MSNVQLQNITKAFGNVVAVNSVNLNIREGSFFTIVGPSGCGKTTTMRLISGLERPDSGTITRGEQVLFSDKDFFFVPPSRRRVGMVFQSYALWPHMSVGENISFGLSISKQPREEVERRVGSISKQLQIDGLETRFPNELSGGQQQRVAIARELVTGSDPLLMDEPLSNLDARLRMEMRAELKRLHRDFGKTIIYVTHDQFEALSLSDEIAVMREGSIQQIGSPNEIYFNPNCLYVAEFIGSSPINVLEGNVQGSNIVCGPLTFTQEEHNIHPQDLAKVKRVKVGLRPEFLFISDSEDGWGYEGRARAVLPAGPSAFLQIEACGVDEETSGLLLMVEEQLSTMEKQARIPKSDERVRVTGRTELFLFFEAETGRRLYSKEIGIEQRTCNSVVV